MIRNIDREDLLTRLSRPDCRLVFVEATDPSSFDEGHFHGAVLLSPADVKTRANAYFSNKGVEIVVYGEGPWNPASEETAQRLHELGFYNLLHYSAGKSDWRKAGLGFEHGSTSLYPQMMGWLPEPDTTKAA
jgi:rhodanese-related sulfurtransferase